MWKTARWIVFRPACLALLALGIGNLLGGLALGLAEAPTTRTTLEAVHANFAPLCWAMIVWAAASVIPKGTPPSQAAAALGLAGLGGLTLAGFAAVGYQYVSGDVPVEPALYLHGVYFNLGWPTLQFAALLACARVACGRPWIGVCLAAAGSMASRFVFELPLLRFGAPVGVWSDMNGYGATLPAHLAAGLYWTGCCVLLLVSAQWRHRGKPPRNAGATAWLAAATCAVAATWLLGQSAGASPSATGIAVEESSAHEPQPVYTRAALVVEFDPDAHSVRSRGAVVVANRHDEWIPTLRFTVRPGMSFARLALTGELVSETPTGRSYRLNRPLEPGETLKIAFDMTWTAPATVLANGAAIRLAALVPRFADGPHGNATTPIPLTIRVGTSLAQTAIGPGTSTGEWKENGRRFFEYRSPTPVPLSATVHTARYATVTENWQGVAIQAHHHPGHADRAVRMLADARRQLATKAGSRYPHRWLHIVEVPDYNPAARTPSVLALSWRKPTPQRGLSDPPTGIRTYSEHDPSRR